MPPVRSVFCALWPWPFHSLLVCPPVMCSEGRRCSRHAVFNIYTDIGKAVPRKRGWKETWREQVRLQCFHFAVTGVKMQKSLPLSRRRVFVLARHNMVTWSKYIHSKGVLWKIIGCSQQLCLFTVI